MLICEAAKSIWLAPILIIHQGEIMLMSFLSTVFSKRDKGKAQEEADCGQCERAGQQDHQSPVVRLLWHCHHPWPGAAHQEAHDVERDGRSREAFLPACSAPVECQAAQGTALCHNYAFCRRIQMCDIMEHCLTASSLAKIGRKQ